MKKLFVLCLCFVLVACTASQAVAVLDVAAVAVSTAASLANLTPSQFAYVTATTTSLTCAASAVQAGGTTASVSLAVTKCGLLAIGPALPPGTPQDTVNKISALVTAITNVIATYKVQPTARQGGALAQEFKLGFVDRQKLADVQKLLMETQLKLAGLK